MKASSLNRMVLVVVNRWKWFLLVIAVVLCAFPFLFYPPSMVHAAIVGSGDVNPADPSTWTSNTTGYIGQSSTGIVTVEGGSGLLSKYGYLGYNSGAIGTATVTGAGSVWTNSSLYVGYNGSGSHGFILAGTAGFEQQLAPEFSRNFVLAVVFN